MNRPSWDEYFMRIAETVSTRATCMRRKVGAVIVKGERMLASGYNGAPRGIAHCADTVCLRTERNIPSGTQVELCRGTHAEQNAILQAAAHGVAIEGATLYCTHQPCVLCAKMIINVGIKRIVFKESFPDELAEQLLSEAKIMIDIF